MKDKQVKYEVVVVFAPKTDEKQTEATLAKVEKWLESKKTKIANKEHMGQKSFEYLIKTFDKGDFWNLHTEGESPVNVKELNVMLNREPSIIRYLVLKI